MSHKRDAVYIEHMLACIKSIVLEDGAHGTSWKQG